MAIPIWSSVRHLSPPPRSFLLFSVFNVVSWQCIVGPAMVLLARHIDMPPSWVGFLNSFVPLSMVLVAFTVPLVTRFGSKRVMFWAWLLRNVVSSLVFLLPWVLIHGSARAGWAVLMAATLGFCVMRALGVGGWFPWLHEVVDERERGSYFAAEASTTQCMNILIMTGQGLVLYGNPGVWSFLMIYAAGILSGLFSLVWMARVPGGNAPVEAHPTGSSLWFYRAALADRRFVIFVATASLCFMAATWIGASLVMFMRDELGMSSRKIMLLTALNSAWILCTVTPWSRYADHSGSGRAMFKALVAHSVCSFLLLCVIPGAWWSIWLLIVISSGLAIFSTAFWAAVHRAMLNLIDENRRVAYTNIWILGTSMAMGGTPILAGWAIDWWGLAGFRTCFIIAGILGLVCAVLSRLAVNDSKNPVDFKTWLLDPSMPMQTMASIVTITVGRHESNRTKTKKI